MTDAYQTIRLGGENRNAESLGDFVAWLVTNNLLDPVLEEHVGREAARVKMQDLTGPAFLTTVLHGELKPAHLTAKGKRFCELYLASGDYDRDFEALEYHQLKHKGDNEWLRYDAISPKISEAFRKLTQPESPLKKLAGKIIQFPAKR